MQLLEVGRRLAVAVVAADPAIHRAAARKLLLKMSGNVVMRLGGRESVQGRAQGVGHDVLDVGVEAAGVGLVRAAAVHHAGG